MKDKFIRKWMRAARFIANDQNPCLSRSIGTVIVDPELNCITSTGYNGPESDIPHADSYKFLREYVYPQLNSGDKQHIFNNLKNNNEFNTGIVTSDVLFASHFEGCKTCPRKLIGAISGARLELCGCAHGERNAITNAAKCGRSTNNNWIFCWCGIPCLDCASAIIQAGITKVYCLKDEKRQAEPNDYKFDNSRWKFKTKGVEVVELTEEWVNEEEGKTKT